MRVINIYIVIFFTLFFIGCERRELPHIDEIDNNGFTNLYFGDVSFNDIKISTKATLDITAESRVQNLFIFIFTNEGRVFSKYFNNTNHLSSENLVQESHLNSWYRVNKVSQEGQNTWGIVHMKLPLISDYSGRMYIIANIDADMINLSAEYLNTITNESDILNHVIALNQDITSRNGYFPMVGVLRDFNITSNGNIVTQSGINYSNINNKIALKRLDSKVNFNFRIATDYTLVKTETNTNGTTSTTYKAKEFIPQSWRVVNLPKKCNLLESDTYIDPATEEGDFFNSPILQFESSETTDFILDGKQYRAPSNGFSFYMLENKKEQKSSGQIVTVHDREKKIKDPLTGAYAEIDNNDIWLNAPRFGTYIEVTGEILMDVDVSSEARTQQLSSLVKYYIHLGDISTNLGDFNILRNTNYTYNVNIKGVDAIELEVTTSESGNPNDVIERNPGAEGMVYIAKESIYTFDAHYGQRVFCFDAAYINPETVTWYVSTPFGKEGVPNKIGDTEIASGMDYKWVKFKINRDTDVIIPNNGGGSYTSIKHNRWYPGDDSPELMDILKFTQYIKAQKRLLDATLYNINLDYTSIDNVNIIRDILRESNIDFVLEEDEEWKNAFPDRPDLYYRFRIYVTTYVDEYYYKVDPISNLASVDLWKRFVNKPNRLMHILCDDRVSLDKASSATGSVITIRQRSIQTPFNINKPTLTTGWGCETIDELEESRCFFFSPNEYYNSSGNISGTPTIPTDNNSPYNGLYNTAVLLGMVKNNNYVNNIKWSTFLDFNQLNDQTYGDGTTYNQMAHFIKEDKLALLYGTLMRNRDNNGNGIIDPDELKWYVGALNQYVGLYIGGEGLTQNAWLYAPRYSTQPNERLNDGSKFNDAYKWRVRVISSTNNTMLWGEEGISTSSYGANFGKPAMVLIKSLRNLGIDNITASQLANKESAETKYDFLINVTKPADETDINAVYSFDLTNVNESSLRFFTTRELEPYTENTEMARCYSKFETGPLVTLAEAGYRRGDYDGYIDLKNDLLAGNSPCPKGYRVANIREGALMSLNCTNAAWWNNDKYSVVTSEFSLRSYESHNGCISWEVKNNHITLNGVADDGKHIRCVRDIR